MKTCSKCHQEKPLTEFHACKDGIDGKRATCKFCIKEYQQKNALSASCICPTCGNPKSKYSNKCQKCARPSLTKDREPSWRKNSDGYIIGRSAEGKEIKQHRWIMEKQLKRKLYPHENIHHKNGIRSDNNIENLELWSKSQPPGQRVEDKISWAISFLKEYGYKINHNQRE